MSELLIDIAGTYLRYVMVGIGVWLVPHHVATADQADQLTMELVKHLALVAPIVAAFIWGAIKNVANKRAMLVALMPNVKTENDVKAQLKTGIAPAISTPPDTVPGIPLAQLLQPKDIK